MNIDVFINELIKILEDGGGVTIESVFEKGEPTRRTDTHESLSL